MASVPGAVAIVILRNINIPSLQLHPNSIKDGIVKILSSWSGQLTKR